MNQAVARGFVQPNTPEPRLWDDENMNSCPEEEPGTLVAVPRASKQHENWPATRLSGQVKVQRSRDQHGMY